MAEVLIRNIINHVTTDTNQYVFAVTQQNEWILYGYNIMIWLFGNQLHISIEGYLRF